MERKDKMDEQFNAIMIALTNIQDDVKTLLAAKPYDKKKGEKKEPTCKGCGAAVRWIVTKNGKKMPLNTTPIQFAKTGEFIWSDDGDCKKIAEGVFNPQSTQKDWFTGHWSTCPNAKDFKKEQ